MRLLNCSTLKVEDVGYEAAHYAILSHMWEAEEVSFQDIQRPEARDLAGYAKITQACSIAQSDGFDYIWIDTCCIDKTSSAELSEAINSMYHWYNEAQVCYVYLSDVQSRKVSSHKWTDFHRSRWFKRGWTLQELLAPATVIFYDANWADIGTKSSLRRELSELTGINENILLRKEDVASASVCERMRWAAGRDTTRIEDRAYSLMGIFGVNMPILYGEREQAFLRLQNEIVKSSDDHTIFVWLSVWGALGSVSMFATSPDDFERALLRHRKCRQVNDRDRSHLPFSVTNIGLRIYLPLMAVPEYTNESGEIFKAVLDCEDESGERLALFLKKMPGGNYVRYFIGRDQLNPFGLVPTALVRAVRPQEILIQNGQGQQSVRGLKRGAKGGYFRWHAISVPRAIRDYHLIEPFDYQIQTIEDMGGGRLLATCSISWQGSTLSFQFRNPDMDKFVFVVAWDDTGPLCKVLQEGNVNSHWTAFPEESQALHHPPDSVFSDRVQQTLATGKTIHAGVREGLGRPGMGQLKKAMLIIHGDIQ